MSATENRTVVSQNANSAVCDHGIHEAETDTAGRTHPYVIATH